MINQEVAGTLKFYFTNEYENTTSTKQLARGLADIFSSQLELGQAEMQSKLLKDAEIKSLQAQVNPHFFFNAINTISALVRIDSEKARKLLLQLSQFFDQICKELEITPLLWKRIATSRGLFGIRTSTLP